MKTLFVILCAGLFFSCGDNTKLTSQEMRDALVERFAAVDSCTQADQCAQKKYYCIGYYYNENEDVEAIDTFFQENHDSDLDVPCLLACELGRFACVDGHCTAVNVTAEEDNEVCL